MMETTDRHYYILRNKKNKEIIFKNLNTACFAEYTERVHKFNTKQELVFFYFIETLKVEEKYINYIEKTVLEFVKIGIPIKMQIVTYKKEFDYFNDLDLSISQSDKKIIEFSLDLQKCKTHQHSVFCLHLCRYLWDMYSPYFLERLWLHKENVKCTFWQAFVICHKYEKSIYNSHQYLYTYNLFHIFTQKEIKKRIALLKKENPNSTKMDFVFGNFKKAGIHKNYANINTTVKEYKKF